MNEPIPMADDYGEFQRIIGLRIKLDRLVTQGLGGGAVFVLPDDILPGVTAAYGMPVVRAPVAKPMLGIPADDPLD